MPRVVDPDQRKREIIDAVVLTLGEGGFAKFSLKAVAERMGGSITLITHYFPNRDALMAGLLDQVVEDRNQVYEKLAEATDPYERVYAALKYFLPDTPENLALERARVALAAHLRGDPAVTKFFKVLEPAMRDVFCLALDGVITDPDVEPTVDILRAWSSGIVLSAVEHPEIWTPRRQRAALERFLEMIMPQLRGTTAVRSRATALAARPRSAAKRRA